jgi:hypothetical protein
MLSESEFNSLIEEANALIIELENHNLNEVTPVTISA